MTDDRAVRLALQAGRYKNERDALRNRLRDLAALLTVAAEADETLDGREAPGLRTAARIVRDQLEWREVTAYLALQLRKARATDGDDERLLIHNLETQIRQFRQRDRTRLTDAERIV